MGADYTVGRAFVNWPVADLRMPLRPNKRLAVSQGSLPLCGAANLSREAKPCRVRLKTPAAALWVLVSRMPVPDNRSAVRNQIRRADASRTLRLDPVAGGAQIRRMVAGL